MTRISVTIPPSLSASEASQARADLWASLEPLLVSSLGAEGAAEWMEFAAVQTRLKAKRTPLEHAA